ncbi:MAG: hypothetical protein ACRDJ2_06790 [Actinomycetota bacterium]
MFNSHIRIVGLIVMLALVGSVSVADAKTRKYSANVVASPLSTANGFPEMGGTQYVAGTVRSDQYGEGAVIDRVTSTGRPFDQNVYTFEGNEVALFEDGMIRSRFSGYSLVHDDGSQEVVIEGRVISGTERFQGRTGRWEFHGTTPPGSTVLTGSSAGRIVF